MTDENCLVIDERTPPFIPLNRESVEHLRNSEGYEVSLLGVYVTMFMLIEEFKTNGDWTSLSLDTISMHLGLSRPTVIEKLDKLVAIGLLRKETQYVSGGKGPNKYMLL